MDALFLPRVLWSYGWFVLTVCPRSLRAESHQAVPPPPMRAPAPKPSLQSHSVQPSPPPSAVCEPISAQSWNAPPEFGWLCRYQLEPPPPPTSAPFTQDLLPPRMAPMPMPTAAPPMVEKSSRCRFGLIP